jgi:hypothetical protein
MTVVDLNKIGRTPEERREAIMWLYTKYGPINEGMWKVRGLSEVVFKEDKHATYFCLRFA